MLTLRDRPVIRRHVDVLVIGGGAAGCLAVVSAAEVGAKVLLAT